MLIILSEKRMNLVVLFGRSTRKIQKNSRVPRSPFFIFLAHFFQAITVGCGTHPLLKKAGVTKKCTRFFFIYTHVCRCVKNFKWKCIKLRDHAEIQKCKCKFELPVHLRVCKCISWFTLTLGALQILRACKCIFRFTLIRCASFRKKNSIFGACHGNAYFSF